METTIKSADAWIANDQGFDDLGKHVVGTYGGQCASVPAYGGTAGINDVNFFHPYGRFSGGRWELR